MSEVQLTAAQLRALQFISAIPGRSGGFYADLGIRVTTISSLERRGFVLPVDPGPRPNVIRCRWEATSAGHAALGATA